MSDTVTGAVHTAGWLIEEGGGPMGLHWIALSTDAWPLLKVRRIVRDGDDIEQYQTPIRRVKDAGEALRFSRREDAEAFATLFNRFLLRPRVTEHRWPAVSAAEGDLLGKALEALRKLNALILFADQDDEGRAIIEMDRREIADAKAILSQAQAREVTR